MNPFRERMNSKKIETVVLCGRAEEHDFCDNCGMLLCEGELCGPPSYEDEKEKE